MNRQHILQQFRTDWRLTKPWIIVWCVACFIHTLLRCLQTFAGIEMAFLETVYRIDWLALVACGMILVQRLIHLDPFVEAPGVTWRVRPASQWDVFLGKMLVVGVAMIGVPLVFETGYFVASGAGEEVPEILLIWLWWHIAWLLPTIALAMITANGRQFQNTLVGLMLAQALIGVLLQTFQLHRVGILNWNSVRFHMMTVLRPPDLISLVIAAGCALGIQLLVRRRKLALVVIIAAIPVSLVTSYLLPPPWNHFTADARDPDPSAPGTKVAISPLAPSREHLPDMAIGSRFVYLETKRNVVYSVYTDWSDDREQPNHPRFEGTPAIIDGSMMFLPVPLQPLSQPDPQHVRLLAEKRLGIPSAVMLPYQKPPTRGHPWLVSVNPNGEYLLGTGEFTFGGLLMESTVEILAEIPFAVGSSFRNEALSVKLLGTEHPINQDAAYVIWRSEGLMWRGWLSSRGLRMTPELDLALFNRGDGSAVYLSSHVNRSNTGANLDYHRRVMVSSLGSEIAPSLLTERFPLGDPNVSVVLFQVKNDTPTRFQLTEPHFRNFREPFESIDDQIAKLQKLKLPPLDQAAAVLRFCTDVINHAPPPDVEGTQMLVDVMAARLLEVGREHLGLLLKLGSVTKDSYGDDEALRAIVLAVEGLAVKSDIEAILKHNSPTFDLVPLIERMGAADKVYEGIREQAAGSVTIPPSWARYLMNYYKPEDELLLIRHLSDSSLGYDEALFSQARLLPGFSYERLLDSAWARRVQPRSWNRVDSKWREAYGRLHAHMIKAGRDDVCLEGFQRINRALRWMDEGWKPIVDALSPISDCPPGISDALPWLERHLHNLRFDASSGRYLETNQTEQK